MNRNIFFVVMLLFAGIFFSCQKVMVVDNSAGTAEWIKVVSDSPVFFIGKIRYDDLNNLYCLYNNRSPDDNSSSAIVKLDIDGNVTGRMNFDSLSIYDFKVIQPDAVETLDGGYLIGGYEHTVSYVFTMLMIKTDATGNIVHGL